MKYLNRLHPAIMFGYFAIVITINMVATDIFLLIILFLSSFILKSVLKKDKIVKSILFATIAIAFITAINVLINNNGLTVLCNIFGRNITLEAVFYGVKLSFLYLSVINWFICYSLIITSDKFIFLFGKIVPHTSLLFCMIMRFIPMYTAKLKSMIANSVCIGKGIKKGGSIRTNIKNSSAILSAMMTSSLENAINTSQSMKNRGYCLKKKTNYSIYKLKIDDKAFLIITLVYLIAYLAFYFLKLDIFYYIFLSLLTILPTFHIIFEEAKWNILKSKI